MPACCGLPSYGARLPLLLRHPPCCAVCPRLCSEVRKTLIGRVMCERYATHLGLPQYLVLGNGYVGEQGWWLRP